MSHSVQNTSWETFLSVLRAGLWEQDLRLPAGPGQAEWERLLALGRGQAVMGLLLRGIAQLSGEQRPQETLSPTLQAWETAFGRARERYARVQETLLSELAQAGLHPRVQKGSEAAKYYAAPEYRQVGDIDLYLPAGEFQRARDLFPDARTASDGAAVFARDSVTVELHPRYYDIHRPPDRLPEPGSPCGEILLLSAHIFKHAMGFGLGCKQLCDLAVALSRLNGRYDKAELQAALKYAGLLRWHSLLCSLLVADFGLDASCCLPDFRPVDPERLRCIVCTSGHFSHHAKRKTATAGAFLRRLPFSLYYAPRETFATVRELALGNLSIRGK
jgi:hypothetical protein